jgi:hypothetical protein
MRGYTALICFFLKNEFYTEGSLFQKAKVYLMNFTQNSENM